MAPKRRATVVKGEASSSDDDTAPKPAAKPKLPPAKKAKALVEPTSDLDGTVTLADAQPVTASPLASDTAPTFVEPAPVTADALLDQSAPDPQPSQRSPTPPPLQPTAPPQPAAPETPSASQSDDGAAPATPPAAPVRPGTAARRRPVRHVEIAQPASPKTEATSVADLIGQTSASIEAGSAMVPKESAHFAEDEFGDTIAVPVATVARKTVRIEEHASDRRSTATFSGSGGGALGVRDATSEPDLIGSPETHRRNLNAFVDEATLRATAAADEQPEPRRASVSPQATDSTPSTSEGILGTLRRKLRSVSIASSASAAASMERTENCLVNPLDESLKRLQVLSSRKHVDVMAHYHPSPAPHRVDSAKDGLAVALSETVKQGVAATALAEGQSAAPPRPYAPIVMVAQQARLAFTLEALRNAERHALVFSQSAQRSGHLAMQSSANLDGYSTTISGIVTTINAMESMLPPALQPVRVNE